LKSCEKPFVIILNSIHPNNPETQNLAKSLSNKYNTKVLAMDIANIDETGINSVFEGVLREFPISKVAIKLPQWMQILDFSSEIISNLIDNVKDILDTFNKIDQLPETVGLLEESQDFENVIDKSVDLGEGKLTLNFMPKPDLYYRILSQECNCEIKNEYHLISYIKQLSIAKVQYEKFKDAIEQVKETGYGVVHPTIDD
jgi:stage IV sporulation protein A